MFHLAANFVALTNAANLDVPALNDDVLQVQNGHHIPSKDVNLAAVYAGATTLLRTRINSPKVRQISPSFLSSVNAALLPPTDPNIVDMTDSPFVLRGQEEIVFESTGSAAGPNNHYIISWHQVAFEPAPRGDIYTIRGTSTTAAVASTWTTVAVAWDIQLPAGRYAVIGGTYFATNAVAFSLIFDNQYWRPGGLGGATPDVRPWTKQIKGGLGKWGEFNTVTLPRVRVLNDSTDATHEFLLDIVRIG